MAGATVTAGIYAHGWRTVARNFEDPERTMKSQGLAASSSFLPL